MATLAVPAPSSAARIDSKYSGMEVPPPVPASSRPIRHTLTYPIWNLVKVPVRLLSPPKATGMVGSVRSLKATPLTDVRLDDVIANKHLSPLSLKDFEGYLVYKEYSAENLYFILWLNEYEKEYRAYERQNKAPQTEKVDRDVVVSTAPEATRTASHLPEYLATSLRRGLDSFFAPDGPLELNLPRATRDKVLVEAGTTGDPKDFAPAREIVEQSLARSLSAYARSSVANAGPRRLVFCFSLGLFVFLLGLVPPLVAIGTNHARGYRVIGLPFILLGVAIMVMALNRICAVIWLLGEDRQLLPYELAAPTVVSGSIVPIKCPTTPRSSTSGSWDEESSYGCLEASCGDESKTAGDSANQSYRTQTSATPYPWEKEAAATAPAVPYAQTASSPRPPSYRSGGSTSRGVVPDSAPVWGPVTAVFSPDVARSQWRIVAYAFLVGVVALLTIGVVLMAVPNA
ncbi:hypothetical protein JCM8115_006124 [Rhodotorula mucilaginosa]|uniref:RGS domain-containing protein n=1 Tax=Rhodotorula mucilaginosa TaxID=5537 RepID=A0A9P7B3K0_RHOMI|nr:hypothetical protein C6P46_007089 [Rhodotorula mucilaginosa]